MTRRSPDRRLFPDTWDIVGGHLEPDETLDQALRREVREETGWTVSVILGTVGEYAYRGDDGIDRLETDFLVRVDGDLDRPRLDPAEHTACRWLDSTEVHILDESADVNGGLIRTIVADGFAVLRYLSP